jgi:8-oxo-dGTP diphosphatase
MQYSKPYIAPTLVVDSVVFTLIDGVFSVLLIKRSREPYAQMWALPGGYCPEGETTFEALVRVDLQKDVKYIEQLYTFDTIARDPRGHAVSVVYMACGLAITPSLSAQEHVQFFPIDQLPQIAYDHSTIIKQAHERMKAKVMYTNAVFALLPDLFTLTQLQTAYEAILGRQLDKRNFRKKFLMLNLITGTDQKHIEGAHRPAQLFKFNQQTLQTLTRSFD